MQQRKRRTRKVCHRTSKASSAPAMAKATNTQSLGVTICGHETPGPVGEVSGGNIRMEKLHKTSQASTDLMAG